MSNATPQSKGKKKEKVSTVVFSQIRETSLLFFQGH